MNFAKDILLIDFETTDIDPLKAKPIQLAAVLLDKNDLTEKISFTSFIKQDLSDANPQALKINGITQDQLAGAPSQNEVTAMFMEKFGTDILLASWVQYLDRAMLDKMLRGAGSNPLTYDYYHYLDLWPLAYTYLQKRGYTGSFQSEEMFNAFDLPPRVTHDALQDCRFEADILRKIINS